MNAGAISVAKDFPGLKQAALELMEESRTAPERGRLEQLAQGAANPDEIVRAGGSDRSLSDGHYRRVGYLLELESFLSVAEPRFELTVAEVRGMLAVASARAEFDRMHPPCRGCGIRLNNEWDTKCNDCQRAAMEQERARRR